MSAFLNSLFEEGTEREYIFWIGRLSQEKNVFPNPYKKMTKRELFAEVVRLYTLEPRND